MCVYVYFWIVYTDVNEISLHTYIHTYIHTQNTHKYTPSPTILMCTYAQVKASIHTHAHMHEYIHACRSKYIHKYRSRYTHTYRSTCIYWYIHTYAIHTNTCIYIYISNVLKTRVLYLASMKHTSQPQTTTCMPPIQGTPLSTNHDSIPARVLRHAKEMEPPKQLLKALPSKTSWKCTLEIFMFFYFASCSTSQNIKIRGPRREHSSNQTKQTFHGVWQCPQTLLANKYAWIST
jgi:hypothetical protein